MTDSPPFRRLTKEEIHKRRFIAGFTVAGMVVGGVIGWRLHPSDEELWIGGGMVIGLVISFFVALARGEKF